MTNNITLTAKESVRERLEEKQNGKKLHGLLGVQRQKIGQIDQHIL